MNVMLDPRTALTSAVTGVATYRRMRDAMDPQREAPRYKFDAPAWDKALRAVKAHAFDLDHQWSIKEDEFVWAKVPTKWRTFKKGACKTLHPEVIKIPAPSYWPHQSLPHGLTVVG